MTLRRLAPALALGTILVVAASLLFTNLDDRYLWDDEAENALLGRSILEFGLPIARAGGQPISALCGYDADQNYLWTYHPWLPMYLTAASFKILGVSTFAARLPFALFGLLAVLSLYRVSRDLFGDRAVALLSAAFLALSVPFLLHARQSRYYAVTVFAAIWMIHFYVGALHRRRGSFIGLVAASSTMFHANHPMFVAMFVSLAAAAPCLRVDRALVRPLPAAAVTLVVNAAWVAIYRDGWLLAFATRGETSVSPVLRTIWRFHYHVLRVDQFALPLVLLLALALWVVGPGRAELASRRFRACAFAVVLSTVFLGCVSVLPATFFRYIVSVLPALAMIQAYVVVTVAGWRPAPVWQPAAAALALLLAGTDALHGWTTPAIGRITSPWQSLGSPLAQYVRELRDDFVGPIEMVVTRLRREAKPGDTIFISYGDLPLRFYTDLRVYGGHSCESLPPRPPDWLVVRYFLRFDNPSPGTREDIARMRAYVSHVPWHQYERIDLPTVDIVWENIPEPGWHQFRMPREGPRLTLWKRVGNGPVNPPKRLDPYSPR
jgi:4-amino-4-deoxy-L-arabinose transferase-like glycosyltransferase